MLPEAETCLTLFDNLRRDAAKVLAGLPPAALNWRPLEGGDDHATNSIAATLTHLVGSQRFWVGQIVGGRDAHRVRAAEFDATATDAAALAAQLEAAFALIRAVLAELRPGQLDESVSDGEEAVTRRYALLHSLEHTALHVGHLQLTRQLWEARGAGG